ncbi:hypothetical protein PSACC_03520, partial [Paramicrosporidium saccamoebae]
MRKWHNISGGINNDGEFWIYLREIFTCEAKAMPSYGPLFSSICKALSHIVVWQLFPRPVGVAYLSIAWSSYCFQLGLGEFRCKHLKGADYLTYNGQCYTLALIGFRYSKIQ